MGFGAVVRTESVELNEPGFETFTRIVVGDDAFLTICTSDVDDLLEQFEKDIPMLPFQLRSVGDVDFVQRSTTFIGESFPAVFAETCTRWKPGVVESIHPETVGGIFFLYLRKLSQQKSAVRGVVETANGKHVSSVRLPSISRQDCSGCSFAEMVPRNVE